MDSILASVKKFVGIGDGDDSFDTDLIIATNNVLSTLNQIGVGSTKGFLIEDSTATWDDITPSEVIRGLLPSYVGLKVKLMFDPPQSGPLMANIEKQIQETEWRISIQREEENTAESVGGMITFE